MSGPILTREQILTQSRRTIKVDVPELGGSVLLREMPIGRLLDMQELQSEGKLSEGDGTKQMLAEMVVDGDGRPMFSAVDIEALGSAVGGRLTQAALKLNLPQKAEDIGKNSEASPNADSSSD